jgi:hypothetical protein
VGGWVDSDMLSNFVVSSVTCVGRGKACQAQHAKGARVSPEEEASCWVPESGATWWLAALGV